MIISSRSLRRSQIKATLTRLVNGLSLGVLTDLRLPDFGRNPKKMRRYPVINATKPVVFILSRVSACPDVAESRRQNTSKKPRIQKLLQQNRIIGDLSKAYYAFNHRRGGLNAPIRLVSRRGTFIRSIEKGVAKGSSGSDSYLMKVAMGMDRLTCHVDGCIAFADYLTKQYSRLKITMIIGETKQQWIRNQILLVKSDWKSPYCGQYWLAADSKPLLVHGKNGPIRVYCQIHKTWEALTEDRELYSYYICRGC